MKKIILPFLITFIILTINQYSLADTATVNATAVRIRETASTNSNIITNVYKDDEVEILEDNGEWYKVKVEEKVGFAKSEFFTKKAVTTSNTTTQNTVLNETQPQNTTTELPITNSVQNEVSTDQSLVPNQDNPVQDFNIGDTTTLTNPTKIRLIPNLAMNSKTEIAQGTNVTIEAKLGNWYKITSETVSGWVTKTKLTKTSTSTSTVQPTTEPAQPNPEPESPELTTNTTPSENVVPQQPAEQPQETPKMTPDETPTNKTAVVIVETARVRKSASKDAGIIDVLDEDDIVTIIGEEGDFYKITCSKISSGYISKSLVKQRDVTSRSATEERVNSTSSEPNENVAQSASQPSVTENDIVTFAKQYLGYPYVLGNSSPEKGFDCSGFTRYVFGHFGYTLGQVAADQTSLGDVVERANLQIGDLILFYNDSKTKIGHCGIYINGGDFIHSANPQRGVVIDNLNTNSYYSQRFVTARRIAGTV